MKYFLQLVAQSLRSRFGNNLSQTVVIFPNKRASLFLNSYLLEQGYPIWAPQYMTISELFTSLTTTQIDDPINTVCRIYKHYQRITDSKDETLDYFYGWGERILADFDDLDKNMGDASLIFRDMREYQEIGEDEEFLTDEQIEQLRKFAGDFSEVERSVVRQRYLKLWNALLPLYNALRTELESENLAYEGQLYRSVVEGLNDGTISLPPQIKHVAFVGFNVLDAAEKKLFSILKEQGKALFYWDYDTFYTAPQYSLSVEAGTFLRENLMNFPNELDASNFSNLVHRSASESPIDITFATANTNTIQAQYVRQWLGAEAGHFSPLQASKTAIVLCDENMLEPVLHALPTEKAYRVNVTKGFPLSHTPAYTCIAQAMEQIQYDLNIKAGMVTAKGKQKPTTTVVPLAASMIEQLSRLQQLVQQKAMEAKEHTAEGSWNDILYTEAFFQVYTTLSRFMQLFEDGNLCNEQQESIINLPTLFRLVRQILRNISIPFHGEPAVGLQVMGVLETRCLDFDHVLMLSVNEGKLPQKATDASFIPFLIRKRYGLTTYVHKVAVYAYYFFRLLQRCKSVTLAYNSSTAGTERGEMSRFMRSLLIDAQLSANIKRIHLKSTPQPTPEWSLTPSVQGDSSSHPILHKLSPSALNTYIHCPRSFYYKYILHLQTPQISDNIIDQRDLGTLFHRVVEMLYMQSLGANKAEITSQKIATFLKNGGDIAIANEIKRAFADKQIPYTSFAETIAFKFTKLLLHYEANTRAEQKAPAQSFVMEAAEYDASCHLKVPFGNGGKLIDFELAGQIDRMDIATMENGEKCLRIIDYKTGGKPTNADSMEQLFDIAAKTDCKYVRQTFLYSLMINDNPYDAYTAQLPIMPALYYVPRMVGKSFTPYITLGDNLVTDFRPLANDFREHLKRVLAEIIDPQNHFETKYDKVSCKWCDFYKVCNPTINK